MATVNWENLPALSQHHDFYRVVQSILNHARALEAFYDQPVDFKIRNREQLLLDRAVSRNRSYYPSDLQIPEQSSSLNDIKYRSRDVSDSKDAGHVAYRTSWSIWNDKPSLDRRLPKLWDLMSSWHLLGPATPASGKVSLHYSKYWLEFDAKQDWFHIYNLCRHAAKGGPRSMKTQLSFCLSAAAYTNAKYADTVPFFIALALDERSRELSPPPELSYTLSDGVALEPTRLKDLVLMSSLPIESIPTHFLMVEKTNSKDVENQRRGKYLATIRRELSQIVDSILRLSQRQKLPDCRYVDFRERWFDKDECRRSIEKYIQSISRNRQLEDHVQLLERILQRYRNVSISIPLTLPYVFSPQFVTNHSRTPSYSIFEVLSCRTYVQTPSADGDPLPPEAGSDLDFLIDEFRNSPQSLLQLYGNELSKSYREQLGQNVSQSTLGALPSYELLSLYHDECSQGKVKLFSEISATLAPSQEVEKTSGMAGLWPRITPRSILSQLTQNLIGTLPDQWKVAITRYAVVLVKYQQSRRLLELLSAQKHEELLREIEAIRNDVLAKSTPDWLLVQVSPLGGRRRDCIRLI